MLRAGPLVPVGPPALPWFPTAMIPYRDARLRLRAAISPNAPRLNRAAPATVTGSTGTPVVGSFAGESVRPGTAIGATGVFGCITVVIVAWLPGT